jgi:hypothetical protein
MSDIKNYILGDNGIENEISENDLKKIILPGNNEKLIVVSENEEKKVFKKLNKFYS